MTKLVIAAVDDMFFASKIRATAEHLGVAVHLAKSTADVLAAAKAREPALIIADLHGQKYDPFTLAEQLKADECTRKVPLIGFFSHVQTALQHKAVSAGYDRVMPRSAFTRQLPQILGDARNCVDR